MKTREESGGLRGEWKGRKQEERAGENGGKRRRKERKKRRSTKQRQFTGGLITLE